MEKKHKPSSLGICIVSVWSGSSRPNKGKLAGIILAQVGASPHDGPTAGAWIQRNAGSPISVVAVYFPALLAEYTPAQGVAGGTCGTEGQHAIKPQKRSDMWEVQKEGVDMWEVQTEGVDIWEVQRPKKEGADMWEVQTDKLWNGKDWSLLKAQKNNSCQ